MKKHTQRRRGHPRPSGFTLIEVLITVAIIAILATIAFASYQWAVTKSRRAAATGCLQERAQFMERFYTTNMTYENAPDPAACDEVSQYYAVSFAAAPTARAFQLQAVPQGSQAANDGKCGTLTIDQTGTRGKSGTGTVDECW